MNIVLILEEKVVSLQVRMKFQKPLSFQCDKVALSTGLGQETVGWNPDSTPVLCAACNKFMNLSNLILSFLLFSGDDTYQVRVMHIK